MIYSRGSQNSLKFGCIRGVWGGLSLGPKTQVGTDRLQWRWNLGSLPHQAKRQETLLSPTLAGRRCLFSEEIKLKAWNVVVRLIEDAGSKWKCARESRDCWAHLSSLLQEQRPSNMCPSSHQSKKMKYYFSGVTALEKDISHFWGGGHLGSPQERGTSARSRCNAVYPLAKKSCHAPESPAWLLVPHSNGNLKAGVSGYFKKPPKSRSKPKLTGRNGDNAILNDVIKRFHNWRREVFKFKFCLPRSVWKTSIKPPHLEILQ